MRRFDSGWRDSRLGALHGLWKIPYPVAGMTFPTLEYDRGEAVAIVNYIRRDVAALPKGDDVAAAYAAFGSVRGPIGVVLPFITVQYDPRNWAMQLFAHNAPAALLLGIAERTWMKCTELHFARLLYRMRDRVLPGVATDQVEFSTAPWLRHDEQLPLQGWPGQDMSVRRRAYEPEGPSVRYSDRNPCADIDLAVVGRRSRQVSLMIDHKLHTAYIEPGHKTHQAMSALTDGVGNQIPSMIVRYDPTGDVWAYAALPLNASAQALLAAVTGNPTSAWNVLPEETYVDLLEAARDR